MTTPTHPFDADFIRELAKLVAETDLSEIEVEHGELKIRVARAVTVAPATVHVAAPAYAPPAAAHPAPAPQAARSDGPTDFTIHPGAVKSPMVGTAYRATEPGAAPFVEVGSKVREGQTLLIIEAMKTMNQIPAPRAGTVTAVLFDDASPVEFGEALVIIE